MKNGTGGDRDREQDTNSPKKVSEILDGIESRIVQREGATPEQALFGCAIGIGVLVVTAIVWICIYWYYNPEFHEHPVPLPQILAPTPKPRITHVFHFAKPPIDGGVAPPATDRALK